jgi:hypothetical protein
MKNPGLILQRDGFDPRDFFSGKRELFGLEVFFHMLLLQARRKRTFAVDTRANRE